MSIALKTGQEIIGESAGRLRVQKKLGEGGQGIVYLVAGGGGNERYAFKHYYDDFATQDQRQTLHELIMRGPPQGVAPRFVWPLDLAAVPADGSYGYLMPLIDTAKFTELGPVWAGARPAPQYPTLCEITARVAESYKALHLEGYCYRDINQGNVLFDPSTGEVLICDNDNVGIDGHSTASIGGTWEFMPPELVLGRARPSSATDKHMLAVWLFYLWAWHHPLHGRMEYEIRSWDLIAKRHVYGTNPIFVFHPSDTRNALPDEYETPRKRWKALPPSLKRLFERAFVEGLADPDRRVNDGEWQDVGRLRDTTLACHQCRAVSLWEPGVKDPECWNCSAALAIPPLAIFPSNGGLAVTLTPDRKILQRHAEKLRGDPRAESVLGEVVQNPSNPGVWGIRNLTPYTWVALTPDGDRKDVPPQKAVPLNPGTRIQLPGSLLEIARPESSARPAW